MALASRFVVQRATSYSAAPLTRVHNGVSSSANRRRWDRREYTQFNAQHDQHSLNWKILAGAVALGAVSFYAVSTSADADDKKKVDYDAVREEIKKILESNPNYDDGSYGPIFVRLAWHAAGTYSKDDTKQPGGSDGSTMRFNPEAGHGANAGLAVARNALEPVKVRHPGITYSDLWSLAGALAIEEMGGPKIKWRPGRSDKEDESHCTPDGRLPDASKGPDHVREIFHRMGFNDREIVALIGCHSIGRCHADRSGFSGPWTHSPTTFSNDFFVQLLNNTWTKKKWNGPEQYEDASGKLMMLPADMALLQDPAFKKIVEEYANDEEKFFKDFAVAFQKLEELGVKTFQKPWYQFW